MDRSSGSLEDYEINFHDEEQNMKAMGGNHPSLRPTPIHERTQLMKSNLPQTHTSTDPLNSTIFLFPMSHDHYEQRFKERRSARKPNRTPRGAPPKFILVTTAF